MASEHENDNLEADEEQDESEEESDETEEEVEPTPAKGARAPRQRPVGPFGQVPVAARSWGIKRMLGVGTFSGYLGHGRIDGAIEQTRWPVEELTPETVKARWGAGTYCVWWFRADNRPCGRGALVTVPADDVRPSVAAAPAASGLPSDLQTALSLLSVIQQQSSNQIQGVAQLAAVMAGANQNRGGGLDVEVLKLILAANAKQSEALVESVNASNRALAERLDALFEDDEDDEDDEPSTAAKVAADVVKKKLVKPGQPIGDAMKAAIANAVAEDPVAAVTSITDLLKQVPAAFGAMQKLMSQQPRPRAHLSAVKDPPPPAAETPNVPGEVQQ